MAEDEVVGWHHRLDGYEFEQALGVGDGQESLVCCSPWGHKESDMTEQLTAEVRLIIAFLPRRKHLLISWLQSPSTVILEPPKIKSLPVSIVPHLFSMK